VPQDDKENVALIIMDSLIMRYILLFVFSAFLSINSVNAQNIPTSDGEKYKTAYNYLLSDSASINREYIVSDTLVFMERSPFWKFFQEKDESSIDCINRIDSIDSDNRFTKEYSQDLGQIFGTNMKKANLYFSKISDNVLFAEYFYRYGLHQDYSQAPAKYNAGYRYLFVFDTNNRIKDVLKQMVAYK
jgi:hypothetical protein